MIWEWSLPALLILCGGYYTVTSSFFAARKLGAALKCSIRPGKSEGKITTFSSLCTTLGATVGVGNIIGVASAVNSGGAGALFWMLAAAFVGMSVKFAENYLGTVYRAKSYSGNLLGGPFCYIETALGIRFRFLSIVYAIACIAAGVLGMGTIIQSKSVVEAAVDLLGKTGKEFTLIFALCLTAVSACVIIGGGKRISKFCELLVPVMSILYIAASIIILFRFRNHLPQVLKDVFCKAFSFRAAAGAAKGMALKQVVLLGIQRGIFSNEAGLGTSAIAAASAEEDDAVKQGYSGIVSVFIDTVVLCTLTGLTVLAVNAGGRNGFLAAVCCWEAGLGKYAKYLLDVFLIVFGFTSILGWNFYVERSAAYLFQDKKKTLVVQILYLSAICLGPFLSSEFAWKMADYTNIFLAIPNLIALILLRKKVLEHMQ